MPTKKTSSDDKVVETKKVKTEKPVKADKPAKAEKPAKVVATAKTKTLKAEPVAEVSFNVTGKAGELIKKYQRNNTDTGSTEVQIALFTAKIDSLAKHLKKHAKDSDSKRGLLMMVGKRRRLLTYLQKNDQTGYENLIGDLGLRK